MATLTPAIAKDLMQQSMTTGVSTALLDSYGGYGAVKSLYEKGGGQLDTSGMSAAELKAAAQKVAETGVGDMNLLARTGTQLTDAGRAAMVKNGTASAIPGATSGSTSGSTSSADSSASTAGYTGLAGANKGDSVAADRLSGYSMPTTRALVELSTGRKIDDWFYDEANPNYSANQLALTRANNAMYGDVGANLDARNWNAIMAAADPIKAAEEALKAMYSDTAYLVTNANHVLAQGYLPEQADYTYQQMADRVGSSYDPNWSKGTKYEGQYDTAAYLNATKNMTADQVAAYENNIWAKWGGNPRLNTSKGVVDTSTKNSVFVPAATAGQITGTSNTTPGSTSDAGSAAVTGGGSSGTSAVTPGSTSSPGLIAAATSGSAPTTAGSVASATTQTAPTNLNTPTTSGGAGLVTGANTLTPGTFSIPNTSTGNVNSGGLISGVAQQLSTQNAQVGLPTGVTPKVGMMGNNTGGASVAPYNPYAFTGWNATTGSSQNWYNPKTGQRWTAPAGNWTPPSADWTKA
jgi:hypothetical protein